jgi:hypothetical protein
MFDAYPYQHFIWIEQLELGGAVLVAGIISQLLSLLEQFRPIFFRVQDHDLRLFDEQRRNLLFHIRVFWIEAGSVLPQTDFGRNE